MRLSRDKLILLGVAALYEAAERATAEPMRPGFALRAVLAMLSQLSDGDRTQFDAYWQALLDPSGSDHPQRAYLRATTARTAIEGILRSLGADGASCCGITSAAPCTDLGGPGSLMTPRSRTCCGSGWAGAIDSRRGWARGRGAISFRRLAGDRSKPGWAVPRNDGSPARSSYGIANHRPRRPVARSAACKG